MQRISDKIADTIGVDRIEGFEGRSFFADMFKRRSAAEVEAHFAWGFPGHVPPVESLQGDWPRPWAFLRVLAAGVVLFLVFLVGYGEFPNTNLVPGLIMTGSFAAPVAMVVFFYEMNVVRNISVYHLIRLFLLGGVAALFLALVLYSLLPIDSLIGDSAAGIIEEAAKLAILMAALRMMRLGPKPYLLNGLLIGATIGAGFAAFESAGYAFQVITGELPDTTVVDVIVERGVLSPFGHIAWTAIAAGALWRVSYANSFNLQALRDPRFLKLFALPVILHAFWDLPIHVPFLANFAVLGVIAVVAVLSLLQSGLRQAGAAAGEAAGAAQDVLATTAEPPLEGSC